MTKYRMGFTFRLSTDPRGRVENMHEFKTSANDSDSGASNNAASTKHLKHIDVCADMDFVISGSIYMQSLHHSTLGGIIKGMKIWIPGMHYTIYKMYNIDHGRKPRRDCETKVMSFTRPLKRYLNLQRYCHDVDSLPATVCFTTSSSTASLHF